MSKRTVLGISFVLIIILAVSGVAGYLYIQNQTSPPPQTGDKEKDEVLAKVRALAEVPTDDQVTIATVSDIEKLKNQTFFAKAQNGDKVVVFAQSKFAVLYRPANNKIIDMSPINIATQTAQNPQTQPSIALSRPLRVAIYNGTTISGLANTVESILNSKTTNVTVTEKTNASNTSHTGSLVINIAGNQDKTAAALANLIGGTVAPLPSGETRPDADILIIAGASLSTIPSTP